MRVNVEFNVFSLKNLFGNPLDVVLDNGKITGISSSSKEIQEGDLFIPLIGNTDGHNYIEDALQKGASYFLCQSNHKTIDNFSEKYLQKAIFVENTLEALGKIASFHRNKFNPYVIGITGSSGKTTTKELFAKALSYLGDELLVTEKNYNNEIGLPFTVLRITEKTKVAILEMGMNHTGEISRLSQIARPNLGFITGIGPCHIENLKSLKNIAKAKAEIVDGMKPNSVLVIPNDVLKKSVFKKKVKNKDISLFEYRLEKNSLFKIVNQDSKGYTLKVDESTLDFPIPVYKIVENLCGVVMTLNLLNLDLSKSIDLLRDYSSKNSRNVIYDGKIKIIDDTYNANPDSMISSLNSLIQIGEKNRLIAVLGDMKELGEYSLYYHKVIGAFAAKLKISGLYSFGADSKQIYKTFKKLYNKYDFAKHYENTDEGLSELITGIESDLKSGDIILVKGSRSMKMERIVEGLKELDKKL